MNPYISPADPRRRPWELDQAQLQMPENTPVPQFGAPPAMPLAKAGGNPVSAAGDATMAGGAVTLNPYVAAAGLGLKAVGTGMEIAGAVQGQNAADRNFELARSAYITQTVRAQEEARRRREQEELENAGRLSRAAVATGQRDYAPMAAYNRAIGR